MNNIRADGSWDWSRVVRVPLGAARIERFLLEPGDVLFNNTNSQELVGKTALFPEFPEPVTFSNHFTRLRTGPELDAEYLALWLHRRWRSGFFFRASTRWVGQAAFGTGQLLALEVPLPKLDQQRRIASIVREQLATAGRAKEAASGRASVSRTLGYSVLAGAFNAGNVRWRRWRLGDVADTRRSPSVSADGDTTVTTITSGCLTPFGFSQEGLGVGKMSSRDAVDGIVEADEVLVARSNTEAFVGRASRYPGGTSELVASDLVFRLAVDPELVSPDYLADYLAALQLGGYWRDRSSGASSTMKKITKSLLLNVGIPIPPLDEQLRIVGELHRRLQMIGGMEMAARVELEAINAVPAALLRRAFEDVAV